jgi:hypothetical protein
LIHPGCGYKRGAKDSFAPWIKKREGRSFAPFLEGERQYTLSLSKPPKRRSPINKRTLPQQPGWFAGGAQCLLGGQGENKIIAHHGNMIANSFRFVKTIL